MQNPIQELHNPAPSSFTRFRRFSNDSSRRSHLDPRPARIIPPRPTLSHPIHLSISTSTPDVFRTSFERCNCQILPGRYGEWHQGRTRSHSFWDGSSDAISCRISSCRSITRIAEKDCEPMLHSITSQLERHYATTSSAPADLSPGRPYRCLY